jgi:hypothetical protein
MNPVALIMITCTTFAAIGWVCGSFAARCRIRVEIYARIKTEHDRMAAFHGDKPAHNWQSGEWSKRQGQLLGLGHAMAIVRGVK